MQITLDSLMYDATAFSRAVVSRFSSPVSEDIGQPLLSADSQYLTVGNVSTPQSCIEPVRGRSEALRKLTLVTEDFLTDGESA